MLLKDSLRNFASSIWQMWGPVRSIRFERGPIRDCETLGNFIKTRAAYIGQTSLYGYLKTRMGTRYVEIFQNDAYVSSINEAKRHIFVACIADLTVFAVALIKSADNLLDDESNRLAQFLFQATVEDAFEGDDEKNFRLQVLSDFSERIKATDWTGAGEGEGAFQQSPPALFDHAPIADELKQFDREIVTNSIRFRWRDVRQQLRKRLDCEAMAVDFSSR